MAFQVTVQYPNGQVLTFPFEKHEVYCGRAQGNDIRLAHSFVSSRHFRIRQQDSRFFVEDVGSTNGTLLNGSPMEAHIPQSLSTDDVIQVGTLEIRLAPIVEATIIERISKPLPTQMGPMDLGDRPTMRSGAMPVVAPTSDAPAPMWQVQTGMIRQQSAGIHIDDQVSVPRREAIAGYQQPGFEERIRRPVAVAAPVAEAREAAPIPWGTMSQVLGGLLLIGALGVMVIVLLL